MRHKQTTHTLCAGLFGLIVTSLVITATIESKAQSKRTSPTETQEQMLAWNLETLVRAYEKIGSKSPKWDEPAKNALTLFAKLRSGSAGTNEQVTIMIGTNCNLAVAAGCNDPMIGYLQTRYSEGGEHDGKTFALAADRLETSQYPTIRKFYASLRAAEHLLPKGGSTTPQEVHKYRRQAMAQLATAVKDKSMPLGEVDEACSQMLEAVERNSKQYADCWQGVEQALVSNWPDEPVALLLKGKAYIKLAWIARGGGYANTVDDQQWKLFAQKLVVAQHALETAWKKDPTDKRIARAMITVELGQGQGRERMELWFKRAMALDPNYYDACDSKRYYLEPKWHGSAKEMLKFGRECVQTKAWGGRVPLVLVDAHAALVGYLDKSEQAAYWKQPEVWTDLQAAFERFFEVEPKAVGWRHNYAKYAYLCGQWDALNKQLPLLGPINYDYFGGKAEFEKMVQAAKDHSAKAKSP